MRYFVDTPMFGEEFMCARVSENAVETRSFRKLNVTKFTNKMYSN